MSDPSEPPEPPEPVVPVEPVEVDGPKPVDAGAPRASVASGSVIRSVALAIVAFAATFLLLAGAASLLRQRDGDPGPTSPGVAVASSAASDDQPTTSPGEPSDTAGASASASASPPGSSATEAVLVGAGDIADCALDRGAATARLLDDIPGTVFTAGDNAYPSGSAAHFRDCYDPTWGRHKARTRPAAGNHDWETSDAAGYLGYFGSAAAPKGTTWYSYELGAWHVVVLDSDCTKVDGCRADSPQGRWLAADLAASDARCTLAIWHHPRFSSGEHGNDPAVGPFWRALYGAGADVVVNGHDHDYERFAPQAPGGRRDDPRGMRQFVVGTGGAVLREFPRVVPNSLVRASVAHGVIRFVLRPAGYEWRFITTTGEFSDSGSGSCH